MLYAGIDLSARRGFDVAILDDERRVAALWRSPTLEALCERLDALAGPFVAAVDAPQRPSDFPLRRPEVRAALPVPPPQGRFTRHRVCDYELARRGISLYLLPEPGGLHPAWMELGFATFRRLQEGYGLRLPDTAGDDETTLLEVYPYASFVTLLGGRPPRKTTREGAAIRLDALRRAGICNLPDEKLSHDAVDALVAAYTIWAWRHGQGCALGLPAEGLMVLPVPADELRECYRRVDYYAYP